MYSAENGGIRGHGRSGAIFSQSSFFRGNRNVPFHSHPGTELIWLRAGRCAITANGVDYPLKPGQFLVLEPEAEHNQICHGEVDNLFVVFVCDPSFFDSTTRVVETGGDVWCAADGDIADPEQARILPRDAHYSC